MVEPSHPSVGPLLRLKGASWSERFTSGIALWLHRIPAVNSHFTWPLRAFLPHSQNRGRDQLNYSAWHTKRVNTFQQLSSQVQHEIRPTIMIGTALWQINLSLSGGTQWKFLSTPHNLEMCGVQFYMSDSSKTPAPSGTSLHLLLELHHLLNSVITWEKWLLWRKLGPVWTTLAQRWAGPGAHSFLREDPSMLQVQDGKHLAVMCPGREHRV